VRDGMTKAYTYNGLVPPESQVWFRQPESHSADGSDVRRRGRGTARPAAARRIQHGKSRSISELRLDVSRFRPVSLKNMAIPRQCRPFGITIQRFVARSLRFETVLEDQYAVGLDGADVHMRTLRARTPRWSVAGAPLSPPASMAGLPDFRNSVCIVPP
jgi:hypothetical protein